MYFYILHVLPRILLRKESKGVETHTSPELIHPRGVFACLPCSSNPTAMHASSVASVGP